MNNTTGFLSADRRRSVVTGTIFFFTLLIFALAEAPSADRFNVETVLSQLKLSPLLFVIAQATCIGGRLVLWYVYLRFEKKCSVRDTVFGAFSAQDYDHFASELSKAVRRGRR